MEQFTITDSDMEVIDGILKACMPETEQQWQSWQELSDKLEGIIGKEWLKGLRETIVAANPCCMGHASAAGIRTGMVFGFSFGIWQAAKLGVMGDAINLLGKDSLGADELESYEQ